MSFLHFYRNNKLASALCEHDTLSKYFLKKSSFFPKMGKLTNFTFDPTVFGQIMLAKF